MAVNHISGFYANELHGNEIWTSFNGKFDEYFREMDIRDLRTVGEGFTPVYTVVLKLLAAYERDLRDGRRVDIYVNWDRDDVTDEYSNIRVERVELV